MKKFFVCAEGAEPQPNLRRLKLRLLQMRQ